MGPSVRFKSALTRYTSLNLDAISRHGTIEMRRFHGSPDPLTLAHYAAFCVGFVEASRTSPWADRLFKSAPAVGLAALRDAQEAATPAELARHLARHVDASTIAYLLDDACPGWHTASGPHAPLAAAVPAAPAAVPATLAAASAEASRGADQPESATEPAAAPAVQARPGRALPWIRRWAGTCHDRLRNLAIGVRGRAPLRAKV